MLIATILVFLMHLGFATLESGLARSKNTVNVLFKNVMIVCIGLLSYAFIGFNLMYPGKAFAGMWFGFSGFGIGIPIDGNTPKYNPNYTYWTDFIFQAMFAATCATIISGAVAERVRLESFLLFSMVYVSVVYPIVGMWKWGGGILESLPTAFYDFAGSSIVHSVGGWGALAGIILLGPRIGKYVQGEVKAIAPHSVPMATLGVFMLWFGWFGFNGGSVLSANPANLSLVFVTTALAAAAGALGAFFCSFFISKKYDLMMTLNGILGGLVGITAGADQMGVQAACQIGLIAGVLVVVASYAMDKWQLDDPVGAIPVHLVCGIWGTLAVAFWGNKAGWAQLQSQLIGIGLIAVFTFGSAYALFWIIKRTLGLRVSAAEEIEGLDLHEHGMSAYGIEVPVSVITPKATPQPHYEQGQVYGQIGESSPAF
jgi:Amt family ammonium transporter